MDAKHEHHYANTDQARTGARQPVRTRRLLAAMAPECQQWLEPSLQRCLDRFDQTLFKQAEHSHNYLEQQHCFDSRKQMQQQRPAFVQTCVNHLYESLVQLAEPEETATDSALRQPLSLVDRNVQELATALDKLAARGEARHSQVLSELSYRFAVLVGSAPLEGAALPVAPANLVAPLHEIISKLGIPVEHQLILLQSFEETVLGTAGTLYEAVNAQLLGDGLLPQLRPYAPPRMPAASRAPPTGESPAAEAPTSDGNRNGYAGGTPQAPITILENLRELLAQRRTAVSANPVAAGRIATDNELQTALGALQQHLAQVTDQASRELRSAQRLREELLLQLNAGKPAGAMPTGLSSEQDASVELVAMLFEQLGQQLHQGSHAHAMLGDLQLPMLRMAVTDRGFFEQHEHPARRLLDAVAEAANDWLDGPDGNADHPLAERLQHLVERARNEPPSAGLYTSLLADIEHHLALLTRRAKTAERRHVEAMQGRERLELARHRVGELLKARFASHPPHGLLRTLLDRAWADVLALTLLQHGEDSVTFAGRMAVTDQLLGSLPIKDRQQLRDEVRAGLQQIGMDTEESSQVAQRLVGEDVDAATVAPRKTPNTPAPNASPSALAATDAHATTEPSAPVPTPPATTTAASATAAAAVAVALPAANTSATAAESHAAPAVDASAAATPAPATASPTQPAVRELPSATDLALRLKQHQRLGEKQPTKPRRPTASELPLGPREASIHNRLRQLPFGTWFEFTHADTGETVRRKLAWFSPVTGNSLFVTRRGLRGEEMNLRELARAMAGGQVRELPPESGSLLDRAWRTLASRLRQGNATSAKDTRP